MLESLLGLTVSRTIPQQVIIGLLTGQYKLYGGVIRWAAGTKNAGQIIRHLLPIAGESVGLPLLSPISNIVGIANTYQLHRLSGQVNNLTNGVQQLFQIANGTMALSGLNLVVSSVGFVVLNEKLKALEGQLNEIQKNVKAIRTLLELEERSRLASALRDLLSISEIKNPDHRHTILFNAKNIFGPVSLKYKELLASADTLELAIAFEEYFCLTSLAHARCFAELGMLDMAIKDISEMNVFWKEQSRRIAKNIILGDNPERLLFSDFSRDIPISTLIGWFDFVYDEEKGYAWIDELRSKTQPYYNEDGYADVAKGAMKVTSSVGKGAMQVTSSFLNFASQKTGKTSEKELDIQKLKVLPFLQKLVARNSTIEGYVEQYRLMHSSCLTPSEFENQLSLISKTQAINGYLILEPSES